MITNFFIYELQTNENEINFFTKCTKDYMYI